MKCQTSGSKHFTGYKKLRNMFLGLLFEEVCSKGNGGVLGSGLCTEKCTEFENGVKLIFFWFGGMCVCVCVCVCIRGEIKPARN